jgi:hypothetical protein
MPAVSSIFFNKRIVSHGQVNYALNQTNQCWNEGPTEKYVQDALPDSSEVKLMNANPA